MVQTQDRILIGAASHVVVIAVRDLGQTGGRRGILGIDPALGIHRRVGEEHVFAGGGGGKGIQTVCTGVGGRYGKGGRRVDRNGGHRPVEVLRGRIDLRLRVGGVAVVEVGKDVGSGIQRVGQAGNAAAAVLITVFSGKICRAQVIGIHGGAGGLLAAIVVVAASARVGVLIVAALVCYDPVSVVRQVVLSGTGIAALRLGDGGKGGACIVIGGSHQIQVVAAVALVQVNAAVAAGGGLGNAAGAHRVICAAAVGNGSGVTVGDQDALDGNRGVGGGLVAGMDVVTAVPVAGVEVAAPIRPAVVAQPLTCLIVAFAGVIKNQLIDELRAGIVVIFRAFVLCESRIRLRLFGKGERNRRDHGKYHGQRQQDG